MRIAVLMTCHNRKEKTLGCLWTLHAAAEGLDDCDIDVFLVDDGSTDGTGEAVREAERDRAKKSGKGGAFEVNIIQGTGNLYWARGMNLAWQVALNEQKRNISSPVNPYDYFLWLNDDVLLERDALSCLIKRAESLDASVVIGACRGDSGKMSYGAIDASGELIPPGSEVAVRWFCGNVVLVPLNVVEKIGIISDEYTHARADFDYAERLWAAKIPMRGTDRYIGVCENDFDEKMRGKGLRGRLELLRKPGYFNLHDLWLIRSRYHGWAMAMISCLHLIGELVLYRPRAEEAGTKV